jgi:glutaminyl-tRNA synthetase
VGGKGKKESNLLMNTKKEINKYVKEKEASNSDLILNNIVANIQSVDNFTLIRLLLKTLKMTIMLYCLLI